MLQQIQLLQEHGLDLLMLAAAFVQSRNLLTTLQIVVHTRPVLDNSDMCFQGLVADTAREASLEPVS